MKKFGIYFNLSSRCTRQGVITFFQTYRNFLILIKRWKTTKPAGKSCKELATLTEEMRAKMEYEEM
jgi:hypothetical protein